MGRIKQPTKNVTSAGLSASERTILRQVWSCILLLYYLCTWYKFERESTQKKSYGVCTNQAPGTYMPAIPLFLKIVSNILGFQPCQTRSYQAPFERRRRAKRAPRVFQGTHTDHPSSAGGRAKRAPGLAQRTRTKHPSRQSDCTATQSSHIS